MVSTRSTKKKTTQTKKASTKKSAGKPVDKIVKKKTAPKKVAPKKTASKKTYELSKRFMVSQVFKLKKADAIALVSASLRQTKKDLESFTVKQLYTMVYALPYDKVENVYQLL